MSLTHVSKGSKVVLSSISNGHGLRKRLQDMGLTPGVEFRIITKSQGGPVIVEVRGARLALGRGIAERIDVELAN